MTIREFYAALEERLPRSLSWDWDNDGISCAPDMDAPVTGVLIALDPTEDAVEAAIASDCNILLTHHPMLFRGLKTVDGHDTGSRKVITMIQNGISAMAFHTRLDALPGGVNDTLAAALGLADITPFGDADGEDGNAAGMPIGRIGSLPDAESFDTFCARVRSALRLSAVLAADSGRSIRRVAVLGGSGEDDVPAALAAGADVFVTGEVKYHQLCDMPYEGMSLIAAGHYHTEFPVLSVLAHMVRDVYAEAGETAVPMEIVDFCTAQIR